MKRWELSYHRYDHGGDLYLLWAFGECRQVSQQVLRLHVLANSDSPQDQALKLKGGMPCWQAQPDCLKPARTKKP